MTTTKPAVSAIMPVPKQCAFCRAPTVALCDWPVERPKVVPAISLNVGYRIFPFSSGNAIRELTSVEILPGGITKVTWDWNGNPQPPYFMKPHGQARLAVAGTCDKPCCDAHRRSVDEHRDYCRDHAREQDELVAKESHG